MKIQVLYEDNHLIAVFKPAGILTQGDRSGDISLIDEVKKYLKEKHKKPGNVFLGLLHRLDRPVSGIVLFAKTSKGASRLSEQFRNQEIEKIYHAIVSGKPGNNKGVLVNFLKKDETKNKTLVFNGQKEGWQRAELFYEVLRSNKKYSLLRVQIKGGKFHQIRAQLASIGCPILGDVKYGAPFVLDDKSIALSAISLAFQLPTKKEIINIKVFSPDNWKKYL